MDMTLSPDLARLQAEYSAIWTIKEKVGDIWIPRLQRKNILTTYGLTAFSSAAGNSYIPPNYLIINQAYTTYTATTAPGATSVTLDTDPTLSGDTQLVLGAGLFTQEVVTFNAISGTGPFTYTLTAPTVNSHTIADPCTRNVTVNDTVATMTPEASYDSTNAPGMRLQSTSGYSSGPGNFILQFYMTGTQAQTVYFMTIGLADTQAQGTGNLHNVFILGFNNTGLGNDLEIDVAINTANSN